MKHLSYFLLLLFTLSGCKSADKLYDAGNYQQVLSKLEGKAKRNNLDRRERSLLVKAANKYFDQEKRKVSASSNSDHYKDWKNAKQKLKRLQKEVDKISAYQQIRESDLDDYMLQEMVDELDNRLYNYTINQYNDKIDDYYETGDRDHAIRAYRLVNDLKDYGASYETMDSLYEKAITLGHRVIAVEFESDIFNSWEFNNNFKREIDLRDDDFNSFMDNVSNETDYELIIAAEITRKDEDRDSGYQNFSDRVIDYYETEIDTSTNQETKTPVYKDIEARVKVVEYIWTVEGQAAYKIFDMRSNRRFDYQNYNTRVEERAVKYFYESGDKEAIPSNIELDNFEMINYNYRNLIEACFENLAEEFNDNARIKSKLE